MAHILDDEAFTKDSFDKAKYIKIMKDKRDNMLKSNADVIEKSYKF
jgi:protein CpxP